ncbi:MAG: hypothetical protein PUE12_08350 [Oscillospiraceae bacterium]|nr:hypothetical protein [Oscillospiraceae bacterium]
MTRTEKRIEVLKKQIEETEARIKEDTENLTEMKTEFDTLTAKKISDFAKKKNIVIDDKFFEMLSMVCEMDSEKINIFTSNSIPAPTSDIVTEQRTLDSDYSEKNKEDKVNVPF